MQKYKLQISNILDIPKSVLLDLSKITIIGNRQLYIENHKGIIEYTDSLVRINVLSGQLVVQGSGLALRGIGQEDIYLEGDIVGINFH